MYTAKLKGPNITLREVRELDRNFLYTLMNDPEIDKFNRGILWELKNIELLIENINFHYKDYGFGRWIAQLNDSSDPIGIFGPTWSNYRTKHTPAIEFSWHTLPEYWNFGYSTEAAVMALDYCFTNLNFDRAIATIVPENDRSINLAKKLGFSQIPGSDFLHPELKHLDDRDPLRLHHVFEIKNWEIPEDTLEVA